MRPASSGPAPKPPIDGDKLQARHRVNMEVKGGRRPPPNDFPCLDCGHVWVEGETRHEYDHFLGYAAEHHGAVEPVCSKCHAQRDCPKAAQVSCIHGHPFNEQNTIVAANGTRHCRECRRAHDRNRGRDAEWWRNYRLGRKSHG